MAVLPQTATEANAATPTLKLGDYVQMGTFGDDKTPMVFRVVAFQQILDDYTDVNAWATTKPTYTRYANPTTTSTEMSELDFSSIGFSTTQKSGYYPLLLYCGTPTEVKQNTGYGYNLISGPYAPPAGNYPYDNSTLTPNRTGYGSN